MFTDKILRYKVTSSDIYSTVLSLQAMFPPKIKPLDIFSPEGGCSEGLDAFRFFFKTFTHVLELSATDTRTKAIIMSRFELTKFVLMKCEVIHYIHQATSYCINTPRRLHKTDSSQPRSEAQ